VKLASILERVTLREDPRPKTLSTDIFHQTLTPNKMESNARHSLAFWNDLIKKTLEEIGLKITQRPHSPETEKLVTFAEYRAWAESLGKSRGWSKETD